MPDATPDRGSSVQGGYALENAGGVHQPGIDATQFTKAEEIGRMLGIVENVGRLVDGHGAGVGGRIGLIARMEALGL